MRIAALDQGTTSTRVLVVDMQGRADIQLALRHQQHHPRPGWVEHDPLELLANLLHQRLAQLPYRRAEEVLTIRQREALELTGLGLSTQDIAERMKVSVATVEKHLRLARKALGAKTTTHAVLIACSRGVIFVDPGEACSMQPPDPDLGQIDTPWNFVSFEQPGQPAGNA